MNLVDDLSAEERLNITGRFNRKLYEHNRQALSAANTRLNLQDGKHVWQVPFFEDTHDEDNDTSDRDSSDDSDEELEKKDKPEKKRKRPETDKEKH